MLNPEYEWKVNIKPFPLRQDTPSYTIGCSIGFTNIPECIINRSVQHCTSSDTMQPLLIFANSLPSLSSFGLQFLSLGSMIPTSRNYL